MKRRHHLPRHIVLPFGIGAIEWEDDPLSASEVRRMREQLAVVTRRMQEHEQQLDAREDERHRRRAQELGREIIEDLRKQRVIDGVLAEHEWREKDLRDSLRYAQQYVRQFARQMEENAAWLKWAKAKLAEVTADVNADLCRAEREKLRKRGVIR